MSEGEAFMVGASGHGVTRRQIVVQATQVRLRFAVIPSDSGFALPSPQRHYRP